MICEDERALIERNQTIKLRAMRINVETYKRQEDVNGLFCNSISVVLDRVISIGLHKRKRRKQINNA